MVACCLCHRVRFGARWLTVPDRVLRRLPSPHSFCPECLPRALAKALDSFPRRLASQRRDTAVVA